MKIYIILLLEFFKVGMFAIGGGYATLPFLYQLSTFYHWFNPLDLTQMVAISNMMPGPIGTNLAAQIGFKAASFWGAFMAVVGILIPSLVFVFIVSKLLKEFEGNKFVKSIFYVLKPTSCAMIVAIGFKLLKDAIFIAGQPITFHSIDWLALGLLLSLFILSLKKNYSPLFYIGISALAGVLIYVVKSFLF